MSSPPVGHVAPCGGKRNGALIMKPTDNDLITAIEAIRRTNNACWERLFRVALDHAEGEALAIMPELADLGTTRRKANTKLMDILRLAFETAPEEARAIMADVVSNDKRVTSLTEQLADRP